MLELAASRTSYGRVECVLVGGVRQGGLVGEVFGRPAGQVPFPFLWTRPDMVTFGHLEVAQRALWIWKHYRALSKCFLVNEWNGDGEME